ncbi:hypothetical protein COV18_01535 [Candidatus Woesearchaeota archaeon CG10_big_fil_rev_8_21_14_0_10_37_12]|nr:MAG: hypothetical protein COV18_01535 [Candidatus Woesearchaeota archaeon CG10_big_fil_rev_8_21_14_0_10_37_12]
MNQHEEKLKKYIAENNIQAEHFSFNQSCHSVKEAAEAANTSEDNLVKNICMITADNNLIVAIVKGEDKASTTKVGKLLGMYRPRTATPDEILEKTGYPCGGTPSFGYNAIFLVDEKVMAKEIVYSGGGSQNSLVKIATKELVRANNAKICNIHK